MTEEKHVGIHIGIAQKDDGSEARVVMKCETLDEFMLTAEDAVSLARSIIECADMVMHLNNIKTETKQ